MIELRFRPIEKPIAAPKEGRKRSTFDIKWTPSLDEMERELKHLAAKDIIVEADLQLSQIRNDGWPYSSAKPATPGIRISFTCKHGDLSYECGTYTTLEANFRAICLTPTNLRAIDRYGAVKGGEQYKGFKALGGEGAGNVDQFVVACEVLRAASGWQPLDMKTAIQNKNALLLRAAYRAAASNVHPDRGGSNESMARVNAAWELIQKQLGIAA